MPYSHSQLKIFDECPLHYRYKYLDKIPEPQIAESPALKFGKILHATLEVLYKTIQNAGQAPEKSALLQYFQSEMQTYRQQYDSLSELPFAAQEFEERMLLGKQMIERYYEQYAPFTETKINGLEQNIHFDLPSGAKFRGIIDRLDLKGDTAIIVDYKTDKSIAPFSTFAESYQQQLTSYAIRVMQHYSHIAKNVEGKLIYLRLQQEITREITREMLESTIKKIEEKIVVVEDTLFRYNMGNKEAFQATEGNHCRRCPYQVLCPLWKHKFTEDEVMMTEIGETSIKKLIDKFYHLQQQKKALEEEIQTIKAFLEEYVQAHRDEGWSNLYGNEAQVKVAYQDEYKAKVDQGDALKQFLLKHDLRDLLSMTVKSKELTKFLQSHPEQLRQLVDLVEFQEKVVVGRVQAKKK
ncbi:MAG: PD-(D/E)XK nuclease family protein [Candidatus Peribacteria bacterium]|jgi:RecB family exonuclease|nr:PD-(D/E)XK nuclease family protein [Candidatus Peribacteria bacterium]